MADEIDFSDPSGAGNFLQRYHQMRTARLTPTASADSATSDANPSTPAPASPPPAAAAAQAAQAATSAPNTPTAAAKAMPLRQAPPSPTSLRSSPRNIPTRPSEAAKSVWGAVFQPYGRSPTGADRYDLGRDHVAPPGSSASEVHAMGSGMSLDDRRLDD